MRKGVLTLSELMFVVGTRAALAAGIALLASNRLSPRTRRRMGAALAIVGAVTTVPAARIVISNYRGSTLQRLSRAFL